MHVLLIDDDRHDTDLARATMISSDLPVTFFVAADEREALDYLRREENLPGQDPGPPSVVFLDLLLVNSRGSDLIVSIRSRRGLARVPIVMLTMSRHPGDVEECYRRGANAYMVKSLDYGKFAADFILAVRFWAGLNVRP